MLGLREEDMCDPAEHRQSGRERQHRKVAMQHSAICGVEFVSRWRYADMWCQPLSMHYCQPLAAGHWLPLATTLSLDSDVVVQPLATAFRDRDLGRTMLAVALRFVVVVERGYDVREIENETEPVSVVKSKSRCPSSPRFSVCTSI